MDTTSKFADGSPTTSPKRGRAPAPVGSAKAAQKQIREDAAFATTLAKGLEVLEAFAIDAPQLGNSEIAERTGIARPTVARLSQTLARLGYLKYDQERAKYSLWTRLLTTSYPLLAGLAVRHLARSGMQDLAVSVRGAVTLNLLDGIDVVTVECARGGDLEDHTPDIGHVAPLSMVAVGRAIFSTLPPAERDQTIARMQIETPDLWKEFGERTLLSAASCQEHGFCTSKGDWRKHMHSVGVPLYQSATGVRFGLSCAIPAFRLRQSQLEDEIGPRLTALAANVRALMHSAGAAADSPIRKSRP